jgi:hypothetical protein
MNKRFILILLTTVIAAAFAAQAAFADEPSIKFSGEAKTGIYWEQTQTEGKDAEAKVDVKSKDDAGGGHGRFRLNIDYNNGNDFGMRMRLNWENWSFSNSNSPPEWTYAFGYGNFFENQMTVSVGKLGASPWGTGGPEMWKELETGGAGGMRTEWKPAFVPGELNIGFVLNYFNADMDQGWPQGKPLSLFNILQESVIGASYSNDLFLIRAAYRFDNEYDAQQDNKVTGGKGEDELVYRIEERVLSDYLPGFKIWALGHLYAISAQNDAITWYRNWLFVEYAPDQFTAQLRFGYQSIPSRSEFFVKPSFYYNLFDKLLSVGASFMYCQDFGTKVYEGSPYQYIEVEPKIQLNFTSSYIAFAYNFRQEYVNPNYPELKPGKEPLKQTQWMNLRFCIYY